MVCPKCSWPVQEEDLFCGNCSAALKSPETVESPGQSEVEEAVPEPLLLLTDESASRVETVPEMDPKLAAAVLAIVKAGERNNFTLWIDNNLAARSSLGGKDEEDGNQDCTAIGGIHLDDLDARWAIVADGVSTCTNGQGAADAACETIDNFLRTALLAGQKPGEDLLEKAILLANKAVLAVKPDPRMPRTYPGPSTTVAVFLVVGNVVYLAWCGDSPIFGVFEEGEALTARLLITPHTMLNEYLALGISREEALVECADDMHTLVRWLGPLGNGRVAKPSFATIALDGIKCLIACSDGISDVAAPVDSDVCTFPAMFSQCGGKANALVELALSQGSDWDNNTCAVLLCSSTSTSTLATTQSIGDYHE